MESKAALWTGRVFTTLVGLFMVMDSGVKLLKMPVAMEATVKIGYTEAVVFPLGVVLLIATILYLVPRTAVLGAILLTAYLGGAVATHVRLDDGAFNTCFPIIFAVLAWGGLFLRDRRIRELMPLRKV